MAQSPAERRCQATATSGVDAESAGENRGGDLGGELEESGAAGLVGADAEVVQSLRQLGGADRPSGLAAGEEPWRRRQDPDGRVPLAVRGDSAGQLGDGLGQLNGGIAEVETYLLSTDLDVLGGQPVDRRRPLGIEEKKQPGEAVFRLEGVVVQEPACDVPAMFVVERLSGAVPADGGDTDRGELVGAGPADEVPGRVAVGSGVVGEPPVEIGLSAGLQCEAVGCKPVQEGDGRMGALTCGHELLRGDGAAVVASAKPSDQVPDRVSVENFALFRVRLGCEEAGEEAFEADHALVPLGQGTDADEDLAEAGEGRAVGQFVEGLVGQGSPAGREVGQDRGDGRLVQPPPGGDGVLGGGDVVSEGFEAGVEGIGRGTQQLVEVPVDETASPLAGVRVVGVGAGGTGVPDLRGGAVRAKGLVEGAGGDRRSTSAGRAQC